MTDKLDPAAIRKAQLRELAPLHDIPLNVSVEIGRMKFKVRDLVRLTPGSVLELRKPAGEPLDICINGQPIGRCEVTMVEQTSGVRLIEVFRPGTSASSLEQ